MKEKEIKEIIKALDSISSAVEKINVALRNSLDDSGSVSFVTSQAFDSSADLSSPSADGSVSAYGVKSPVTTSSEPAADSAVASGPAAGMSPSSSGKSDPVASIGTGFLDVLDLSGDIKKVQLALMRLGKGTATEIANAVSLDVEEVAIYLKTLKRDNSVAVIPGKGSETVYRSVLKKKGTKDKKKSGSLFDKLI